MKMTNAVNESLREFANHVIGMLDDRSYTHDMSDLPNHYIEVGEPVGTISENFDAFMDPNVLVFVVQMLIARLANAPVAIGRESLASPSTTDKRAMHILETIAMLTRNRNNVSQISTIVESLMDAYEV